jgi:hypothetical protein
MRVLVRTNYTGSFNDSTDMTHVLVDIDPQSLLDARARLADVLALPGIYSVTFFDYTPQPVTYGVHDEAPDWLDEAADVITVPDDVSPSSADLRISAPTVRYMPDGIMWSFYEKHGGDSYETVTIPWDFIRAAAKDKGGNRAKVSR